VAYEAFISYAHAADGALAPAVQHGLQQLAKPWNRRRAVRVFLDEMSLPASSGLTQSLQDALDASDWLILLASPESARSHWVGEEIRHWVRGKGTDRILVVVTGGTWIWDAERHDLSPESTAAHPALRGVFAAEPRYVDMTWAQRGERLTLRNARFRDQVATLAAAVRGLPKEDIEGEDVRQHQRTRHIVQAVIASLTVLVVLASVLAVLANVQRNHAVYQRNAAIADQLSIQSQDIGDSNPVLSRLLSVAAWDIHPSSQAYDAMLAAATRPGIAVLSAGGGAVYGTAFSPNGEILATANNDGTVRLWDTATHEQISRPLNARAGAAYTVAFNRDGGVLAAGYHDGTVRLWSVATHRQMGKLGGDQTQGVNSVAFSPDGKILASGDNNGIVQLWNVATQRMTGPALSTGLLSVNAVAFSPDAKILAAATHAGSVQLWDVSSHRQIGHDLPPPARLDPLDFSSVAFSPDGKTLASTDSNSALWLWNTATERQITLPFTGHAGLGSLIAFSPDGTTLASASVDGTVRLWNAATGTQIGGPLTGHTSYIRSLAFSPDGTTLASASDDGTVRLWDMAFQRARTLGNTSTHVGFPSSVYSVAFSPDGKTVASATDIGTGSLWDPATGHQITSINTGLTLLGGGVFSPNDRIFASTTSVYNAVRLWDVATKTPLGRPLSSPDFPGNVSANSVLSVAFSPDGRTVASGSLDGVVRLWDVGTSKLITSYPTQADQGVNSLAFGPDGKTLAAGIENGAVWMWNLRTHRKLAGPLGSDVHNFNSANSMAFSPDGKILAIGDRDGTVWLRDAATGRLLGELPATNGGVDSVAFSPGGTILATGNGDGTIRLWDVGTAQLVVTVTGDTHGGLSAVAFSPDGRTLASGGAYDPVRVWGIRGIENPVRYLCASAARTLTRADWTRYVPPGPGYVNVCP
jgi:WD40 repeat protein